MSKRYEFKVKLNNGKEVGVISRKDPEGGRSLNVCGGHSFDSVDSIKSNKYLNENTPNVPKWLNDRKTK